MKKSCIVVDSSANVYSGQFDDVYVLPLQVIEKNGQTYKDGVEIETKTIEQKLLNHETIYKTSSSTPNDIDQLFATLSNKYEKIYVFVNPETLSIGQNNVVRMVAEDYPSVSVIRNFMVSIMALWQCEEMVQLNKLGKLNAETALEVTEKYRDKVAAALIVPDLSYLVAGGRISKTKGFIAHMLKITALVSFDQDGVTFRDKSISIETLGKQVINYFNNKFKGFNFENIVKIGILKSGYTSDQFDEEKYANLLRKTIISKTNITNITIGSIPGAILAHVGPNYYAIALMMK